MGQAGIGFYLSLRCYRPVEAFQNALPGPVTQYSHRFNRLREQQGHGLFSLDDAAIGRTDTIDWPFLDQRRQLGNHCRCIAADQPVEFGIEKIDDIGDGKVRLPRLNGERPTRLPTAEKPEGVRGEKRAGRRFVKPVCRQHTQVLSQNFVLVKCALSLGTIMLRALQRPEKANGCCLRIGLCGSYVPLQCPRLSLMRCETP